MSLMKGIFVKMKCDCKIKDYANGWLSIYFCKPYTYGIFEKYVEETDEIKRFAVKVKCDEADDYDEKIAIRLVEERAMTKYLKYVKAYYTASTYKHYKKYIASKEKLDRIDRKLSNIERNKNPQCLDKLIVKEGKG